MAVEKESMNIKTQSLLITVRKGIDVSVNSIFQLWILITCHIKMYNISYFLKSKNDKIYLKTRDIVTCTK